MRQPPSSLFKNYVNSIYEETDFTAHHRLHSDFAYLLVGPRVDRKMDLPVENYVRDMDNLLRGMEWDQHRLRLRQPCFRGARLRATLPGADGEAVALVDIEEIHSNLALTAAFGVVEEHGRWLVRWVTLTEVPVTFDDGGSPVAPLFPARLCAQAHAEMAYVPPLVSAQTLFLSLLEVSFYRQHMRSTQALSYLPEARFTCHMSGRCCVNWSIRLSENDRAAIDASGISRRVSGLHDKPLYARLPQAQIAEDEHRPYAMNHRADGTCGLLGDDNHCRAHEDAGMAVYHDCHVFSYGFTRTPDGVAVWSSLFCPSARYRKGRGFADNEADIRGRLQRVGRHVPTAFLLRSGQAISWPTFRAAETELLAILDPEAPTADSGEAGVPMRQRLLAALRYLEAWTAQGPAAPPSFDRALLRTPLCPPVPEERAIANQVLALFTDTAFFRPILPPAPAPAPAPASAALRDEFLAATPFMPYLLRTLVFSKFPSYSYGVVPGFNFVVLAYCLLVNRFAGWAWQDIREQDWSDAFSGLQHSHYRKLLLRLHADPFFSDLGSTRFLAS